MEPSRPGRKARGTLVLASAFALSACAGVTEPPRPTQVVVGTATVTVAGDFSPTQHASIARSDVWARSKHWTVMYGPTGYEKPIGESVLELVWHHTGVVGPAPLELRVMLTGDIGKLTIPHVFSSDSLDASLEVLQVDSGNVVGGTAMYQRVSGTLTVTQVTDSAMLGTFTIVYGPNYDGKPAGAHLTVTGTFNAPWCEVDGTNPLCTPGSQSW